MNNRSGIVKNVVFVLLVVLLFGKVALADVSQFVFVTDPQVIPVNTNSGTITLQSQNSAGVSENVSETTDLVFTSSSVTGVFLSTSGNAVTPTMSKNTANKNFMYVDPASGTFTLTVKATGRTSLQTYTATQQITVGSASQTVTPPTPTSTPTPTPSTTPSTPPPPVPVTDYTSAHSSPAPLSDTSVTSVFEVSAGRDRLTSVGNSVMFKATVTKLQNISESGISYEWSFGDGATGQGSSVHHAYRFPGTYPVVLNATFSDKQAVSRLMVKVMSPEISLARVSGGIEIWNKSNVEINLEGWKLVSGIKSFVFPSDSLIPSGGKIDYADEITAIKDGSISLQNPLGKVFVILKEEVPVTPEVATTTHLSLAELQDKIKDLKTKLSQISPSPIAVSYVPVRVSVATTAPSQIETLEKNEETAAVINVFTASSSPSVISKIFSWPAKGYGFVRHLFMED